MVGDGEGGIGIDSERMTNKNELTWVLEMTEKLQGHFFREKIKYDFSNTLAQFQTTLLQGTHTRTSTLSHTHTNTHTQTHTYKHTNTHRSPYSLPYAVQLVANQMKTLAL